MVTHLEAQARLIEVVDRQFAERVDYRPMKDGRADPSRPITTIIAPLRAGSLGGRANGEQMPFGSSWSTRMAEGRAQLFVSHAKYPGFAPKQGDTLRALDRPGQPWFNVHSVNDRVYGRLLLELTEG